MLNRSTWRRLGAVLTALAMTLVFAFPAFAYDTHGPSWEWRTTGSNYADVYVCAAENFDRPDGEGWDYSISRHDAIRDGINHFNSLGLKLTYLMSDWDCNQFASGNNVLEIRWAGGSGAPNDPNGQQSIAYFDPLVTSGGCITHCLEKAQIVIDGDGGQSGVTDYLYYTLGDDCFLNSTGEMVETTWKVTSSLDVPDCKVDFRGVFVHELGHAGALDHSSVANSIMCSPAEVSNCYHSEEIVGPESTTDRTYDADDIAGFCAEPWNDDPNIPGNSCS